MTTMLPAVKRMSENTPTSSIGWSVCRSQAMNPMSRAAARPNATTLVGDVQPCSGPSMTAHTSVPMPAIDSTVPSGSKRWIVVSREVGTTQRDRRRGRRRSTGTLIISTEPHQKCSSRKPTGHRAEGDGETGGGGPHRRWPSARSLGAVKTLTRMASVAGNISAAPMPIAARQPIRASGLSDSGGERRERGEQGQADLHQALAADPVAEAAGGHQQAGEDEHVGVDDPLQLAGGGAELGGQRRQGDVDDRAVEDDDEHGGAEDGRGRATRAAGGRGAGASVCGAGGVGHAVTSMGGAGYCVERRDHSVITFAIAWST